jgi:hypothetical protein
MTAGSISARDVSTRTFYSIAKEKWMPASCGSHVEGHEGIEWQCKLQDDGVFLVRFEP